MKFRDIAKLHAYSHGAKTLMTEEQLGSHIAALGEEDGVTPGRLIKANDALVALANSLANKWDIPKKLR